MTAEENELRAAAQKAFTEPFDAVIALEPTGGKPLWVDGWKNPPAIKTTPLSEKPANCIWRASPETFRRIFESERGLENNYISGRLSIAGDMSVMNRLKLVPAR